VCTALVPHRRRCHAIHHPPPIVWARSGTPTPPSIRSFYLTRPSREPRVSRPCVWSVQRMVRLSYIPHVCACMARPAVAARRAATTAMARIAGLWRETRRACASLPLRCHRSPALSRIELLGVVLVVCVWGRRCSGGAACGPQPCCYHCWWAWRPAPNRRRRGSLRSPLAAARSGIRTACFMCAGTWIERCGRLVTPARYARCRARAVVAAAWVTRSVVGSMHRTACHSTVLCCAAPLLSPASRGDVRA
jgi:hypothetical protein